uniref:THAP domain-containing protein 1 n=1 Tax=Poecilia reticulata TaxID=8081 RepID=A0A3P9N0Y9_POERE
MPSFGFLDKLEQFFQTGKFGENSSKSLKKGIKAACKRFIYKDGLLMRPYRGRLLRVVRSEKEIREILTRYHDDNNHAGRERVVREIMLMYYWVGVTETVKNWVKACPVCHSRPPPPPFQPAVLFCLVYGCDASSYAFPELTFHRFPKVEEQRRKWLQVAQRDEASLRTNSYICSRHFEMSCFTLTEDGQLVLSPDAAPTLLPVTAHGNEVSVESALQLQEHQYCLPGPAPDCRAARIMNEHRRRTAVEPGFITYNHIARYLSTRVLPMQGKRSRSALKRMAKRFSLIDGLLMYTRVSPPLRVPRSREEVNSILQQFHDNQGHYGQGICQRQISKHYYWGSLSRDLASWISSCQTCVNRSKRKMIRCSVSKCTNRCGPVERKLGLIFHRFPLHNLPLLSQWLKACGRGNWHPRLWSSICSAHFTEKCYDSGGEKTALLPDAVPTLNIHNDSKTDGLTSTPAGEEAFFAKYNAVELYISRRIYPPGLTYVEKNTFRRFCKRYTIIDDKLHIVTGDQMRLVLRSRQQVETALLDFHNELNHLNVNKCLRLLNERYYWQTMKPDVVQWINNCSRCSLKMKKKPCRRAETDRSEMQSLTSAQHASHSDDGDDDDDDDGDEYDGGDNDNESGCIDGVVEEEHTLESVETMSVETLPFPVSSSMLSTNPQPRIPILIHLKTPCQLQNKASIILQPRIPNSTLVARMWPNKMMTTVQSDIFRSCDVQSSNQSLSKEPAQPHDCKGTISSENIINVHHFIKEQSTAGPSLVEPHPHSEQTQTQNNNHGQKTKKPRDSQRQQLDQRSVKRKRGTQGDSFLQGSSSSGLEPVVAPSSKPWPVFTIANSAVAHEATLPPKVDGPPVCQKWKRLQARTIIQQCSQARVKVRPAVDGADADWVQIEQGLVVYVCFFQGATEEVTLEMANKFMSTKVFRKDRHTVSVLDLPGSVLLVPQDSLVGEPLVNRRIQYKDRCEPWLGAQLFSSLVGACRQLMSESAKCTKEGMKVEHGVYGQKQEISIRSLEPLSLLLEF